MGARGMAGFAPLALLFALSVTPPNAGAADTGKSRDQVLPGCGICYPGGFDINTVGDVSGTILDLQTPPEGPVRLVVAGERERWVVLASPVWFWNRANQRLVPGDAVIVRGSKTLGSDGILYVVAQEIRSQGSAAAVVLRDRRGTPLWRGTRHEGQLSGSAAGDNRGQGKGRRNRWR